MADPVLNRRKVMFRMALSSAVFFPSIAVIFFVNADPAVEAWAQGMAGAVVGYWLR